MPVSFLLDTKTTDKVISDSLKSQQVIQNKLVLLNKLGKAGAILNHIITVGSALSEVRSVIYNPISVLTVICSWIVLRKLHLI